MHIYKIFTRENDGGYGRLRQEEFNDDEMALNFARALLSRHSGVDVWRDEHRIALLTANARIAPDQPRMN